MRGTARMPFALVSLCALVVAAVFAAPAAAEPPQATIEPVAPETVTSSAAAVAGTVDPNGLETDWWLEYAFQGSTEWTATAPVPAGEGEAAVPVGLTLEGLQPNRAYEVKVVASNIEGTVSSAPQGFTTDAVQPSAYTHRAVSIATDSAFLRGSVNPHNLTASYYFEWGTSTAYGGRLPAVGGTSVGDGGEPVLVARKAIGLQPGTTYHFRIVAVNDEGVSHGDDVTFTTDAGGEPSYGYEMVSPVSKNGGYVAIEPSFLQGTGKITDDGASAMFTSKTAFAGQQGSAITNTYRSLRSSPTWVTRGVTPPVIGSLVPFSPSQGKIVRTSDDQTKVVVETRANPDTGAREGRGNYYFRDLDGGPYVKLTPDALSGSQNYTIKVVGAASDLSRIAFTSTAKLLEAAPAAGQKLYVAETATGALTLASVSGGSPGTPLTLLGSGVPAGSVGLMNVFSSDGRFAFFETSAALWVRDLEAGQSHELPGGFLEATPDGRYAFVSTDEQLVATDANSDTDLYRLEMGAAPSFDPVLISADEEPADGTDGGLIGTVGAAEDGEAVFFTMTDEQLVAGGPLDPEKKKVYSWQGGELGFVGDYDEVFADAFTSNGTTAALNADVSPDGSAMVFRTNGAVIDEIVYDRSFYAKQMYLYDADDSTPLDPDIACISCLPVPNETPVGDPSDPFEAEFGNGIGFGMFHPSENHFITNDARVFFEPRLPLVPGDVNGLRSDVYTYHEGELELISSGRSAIKSVLFTATPDGSSVLFATADRLSGWDEDGQLDAYVARLGDVLPGPPQRAPECIGDACLAPPVVPNDPTPSSSTFSGPGNPVPAGKKPRRGKKKCEKGKVRKGGKCVKKGKGKKGKKGKRRGAKNRAKHDRRAGK